MSKLLCSLVISSMVFASGTTVFAGENNNLIEKMNSATLAQSISSRSTAMHRHGGLKAAVDKLVEEGKLSREKAEAIEKFIKQKRDEHKEQKETEKQNIRKGCRHSYLDELVESKIITESEAEAIRNKIREMKEMAFDAKLTNLTKRGIITQAQAEQVKVYFNKAREERKEKFKSLQNMTEEQRKAFFKEYKAESPLTKLVNDGVLTKEQAGELHRELKEGHKNNCKDQ